MLKRSMSELRKKLDTGRMVSLNIRPSACEIGMTEIINDELRESFYTKFSSPEASDADTQGLSRPRFREVWPFIDSFVGDSVVTAFSHGSHMKALKGLTAAAGIETPDYYFIDGQTAAKRHLGHSSGGLIGVAKDHLFSEEELDMRRLRHYANPDQGQSWLLFDSAEHAEANAMIYTRLIFPARNITLPSLLTELSMKAVSLRTGKPVEI